MVPGRAPVSSRDAALMSGSKLGTRPYTALYGVASFTLKSALPENIASDKRLDRGMSVIPSVSSWVSIRWRLSRRRAPRRSMNLAC